MATPTAYVSLDTSDLTPLEITPNGMNPYSLQEANTMNSIDIPDFLEGADATLPRSVYELYSRLTMKDRREFNQAVLFNKDLIQTTEGKLFVYVEKNNGTCFALQFEGELELQELEELELDPVPNDSNPLEHNVYAIMTVTVSAYVAVKLIELFVQSAQKHQPPAMLKHIETEYGSHLPETYAIGVFAAGAGGLLVGGKALVEYPVAHSLVKLLTGTSAVALAVKGYIKIQETVWGTVADFGHRFGGQAMHVVLMYSVASLTHYMMEKKDRLWYAAISAIQLGLLVKGDDLPIDDVPMNDIMLEALVVMLEVSKLLFKKPTYRTPPLPKFRYERAMLLMVGGSTLYGVMYGGADELPGFKRLCMLLMTALYTFRGYTSKPVFDRLIDCVAAFSAAVLLATLYDEAQSLMQPTGYAKHPVVNALVKGITDTVPRAPLWQPLIGANSFAWEMSMNMEANLNDDQTKTIAAWLNSNFGAAIDMVKGAGITDNADVLAMLLTCHKFWKPEWSKALEFKMRPHAAADARLNDGRPAYTEPRSDAPVDAGVPFYMRYTFETDEVATFTKIDLNLLKRNPDSTYTPRMTSERPEETEISPKTWLNAFGHKVGVVGDKADVHCPTYPDMKAVINGRIIETVCRVRSQILNSIARADQHPLQMFWRRVKGFDRSSLGVGLGSLTMRYITLGIRRRQDVDRKFTFQYEGKTRTITVPKVSSDMNWQDLAGFRTHYYERIPLPIGVPFSVLVDTEGREVTFRYTIKRSGLITALDFDGDGFTVR